jgi:hypothetical protein
MRKTVNLATLLIGMAAISSCATPFVERIGHDHSVANAPGTIVLGEPRVFSREDLISERARDVAYLQKLISESENPEKVSFKPELFREVETIKAFALALGMKVDPLAGATNRRNAEIGEYLHEIDVLIAKHNIEQIMRDIEIRRAGFATQSQPVNSGLGTVDDDKPDPALVTVSALDQLKASIEKLQTAITTRLDADGKPPAGTTVTSNPFDEYRDRSAYRGMLKGELNAANLDQLHDAGNARLMRLNFEASVVPVKKYLRSLGVVQVRVIPPSSRSLTSKILDNWLSNINTRDLRVRAGTQLSQDFIVVDLIGSGGFKAVPVGATTLLLPVVLDPGGREWAPDDILRRARWDNDDAAEKNLFDLAIDQLSSLDTSRSQAIVNAICKQSTEIDGADKVERALLAARDRELTFGYYLMADKIARDHNAVSPFNSGISSKLEHARRYARQVQGMMAKDPHCESYLGSFDTLLEWKAFADVATGVSTSARVYQVGPREQAQQISTVARSANNFALAASIAGSAPNAGAAVDAATSYSRQAMGRASALERTPLLSGYAVGGDQAFGWVVGPRAVLNPRGRVEMEQVRETYDVWVDLSVPGWWGDFELEATSVWAPSPESIAQGSVTAGDGGKSQRIKVNLIRTPSDYDAVTDFIIGNIERRVIVRDVQGGPVNACAPTTLWIRGDNIWRAESVFVLGQLIKREQFTITPDMRGIMVTIPALTAPPSVNLSHTKLSVITPLGPGFWDNKIEYLTQPSGDACKPPKPAVAANASDAATISEIKPALEFSVPSKFSIQVTGVNLNKVARVELHGQAGVLKVSADGKSLSVDFDEASTSAIPTSDNVTLEFIDADKKSLALRRVRIQRTN